GQPEHPRLARGGRRTTPRQETRRPLPVRRRCGATAQLPARPAHSPGSPAGTGAGRRSWASPLPSLPGSDGRVAGGFGGGGGGGGAGCLCGGVRPRLLWPRRRDPGAGANTEEGGVPPLATLNPNTGAIWAVTFSPDSATLAMGIDDGTVKLWDLKAGRV